MNSNKFVIHIGLHKTGTTFLQSQLWPLYSSVHLIKGWDTLRKTWNFPLNKQIVVTDEGISGHLFKKKYLQDFYDNLDRLSHLFGDPKIIVGFRKQEKFVLSVYKQYLHQGGTEDFSVLFDSEAKGWIKPEELLFQPRIAYLKEKFSEVFVYNQEDLLSNRMVVVDAMMDFMNVKEKVDEKEILNLSKKNVGVRTQRQVQRLQKLNRINHKLNAVPFFPSWYSRPFKKLKITPRDFSQIYMNSEKGDVFNLDEKTRDFMSSYYREDWDFVLNNISYNR